MNILVILLISFGAYRVWIRPSFFGAKKQWAKLLLFLLTGGVASFPLAIEAFVSLLGKQSKPTSANKNDP